MLKLKLQRIGRANDPHFRVVVIDSTKAPKSGSFIEEVGSYNPKSGEAKLKNERVSHWLSVGVKPSATIHNILVTQKIIDAPKIHVSRVKAKAEAAPTT
jgi:small subunit ribosomal protein S16